MNAETPEGRALLCQCLAAVSMADGDLDGREIATQISIVEQITGVAPDADEIVSASIEIAEWQDFVETLTASRAELSDKFRTSILQACILIGRADDSMSDAEAARLLEISGCLGFDEPELDRQLKIIR